MTVADVVVVTDVGVLTVVAADASAAAVVVVVVVELLFLFVACNACQKNIILLCVWL